MDRYRFSSPNRQSTPRRPTRRGARAEIERVADANPVGVAGGVGGPHQSRYRPTLYGSLWTKHDVDPVVGGIPGLRWEGRGGAVGKYAVPSRYPVGQGMQRRVVHPCRCEGVHVGTVVPRVGVVRRHVHRVGRDGHRGREQHLLPARTRSHP